MNKKRVQFVAAFMLVLVLFIVVLASIPQETAVNAQRETAVTGVTTPLLQYQGRLSDPGSGEMVVNGNYTMVFRIYADPSGGTALWTEIKDVSAQGGLFSTVLGDATPLSHDLFNGQTLWLGIKVGADEEASPRQQLLPVSYALSLVPGAVIQANSEDAALSVNNNGNGAALHAGGPVAVDGNLNVGGSLIGGAHTHDDHNNNASAHHTRYSDAEAANAALNEPEIVTEYEFQDHVYGGLHDGRALAMGVINYDGSIATATGNVSSRWDSVYERYEITIDGHYYEWQSYVTVVTPLTGIPSLWSQDGKLMIEFFADANTPMRSPFQFVTYQP